jgi:DNA-binding response OmpR family regulator
MKPSILIVEDDPFTASLLTFLFKRELFDVQCIPDGQAAMDHLQQAQPVPVVLLDLMLPHVSGMDLLAHIKRLPAWNATRVLVLSAKDQVSDMTSAFALGADDYLVKPFDPQELLARVRRFLA